MSAELSPSLCTLYSEAACTNTIKSCEAGKLQPRDASAYAPGLRLGQKYWISGIPDICGKQIIR